MLGGKVRIGIDVREFVGTTTGIARLLSGLFERLPTLRPEWEFIFFGNRKTLLPFQSRNSRLLRLWEPMPFWWDQVAVVGSLSREKIDLFISPYYKIPLLAPCPVVHIIHDIIPLTSPYYGTWRYLIPRLALEILGRLCAGKAAVTLTDSFYTKEMLLKRFHLSDQKVHVIYPGIGPHFSPSREDPSCEGVMTKYRIRKPYLLYVGNFKPHKQVHCLIQAFGELPEPLRSSTQLVLAGRRSQETKSLERLIEELRLEDSVLFTDFVSEEDLSSLYGGATLFVFPSSDEGFGLPPLEAMACGVPVIASNAGSLSEVLGHAAILVESGNPKRLSEEIARLLRDEEERKRRIETGFEHIKQFSVESQTRAFLSVLEDLLTGGSTA